MRFADINPLNKYAAYKALRDPLWHFSARGRTSRRRIATFKDKHKGERAAIIGSGPSLRKTDFSALEGRSLFGMNRLYTGFEKLGLAVDYYLASNEYVLNYYGEEIVDLGVPLFAAWTARNAVPFRPHVSYIYCQSGVDFEHDLTKRVPIGATVTHAAIQLAYYMGFSDVVLVGIDHRFSLTAAEEDSGPNAPMRREGEDPNHFDSSYFPEGVIWQTPDLKTAEHAYALSREAYEKDGRAIYDGTVDGALDVFAKFPTDLRKPSL